MRAAPQPKIGSASKRHSCDARDILKGVFPRAQSAMSGDETATAQTMPPAFLVQGSDTAWAPRGVTFQRQHHMHAAT